MEEPIQQTTEEQPQKSNKLKVNRFSYHGKGGKLFVIMLVNFLLTVLTLGIYRFWAKTRVRGYKIGNLQLAQDNFEYSGTGKELFIGFIKILPLIVILLIPYNMMNLNPEDSFWITVYLVSIPLIIYFVQVAVYASARYISNRTKWRSIRGHLKGSAFRYGGFALWRGFLNVITLGLLKPWSDIKKHEYIMNNMNFGNTKAKFVADAKGLYGPYLIMYSLPLIFIVLGIIIAGIVQGQALISNAEINQEQRQEHQLNNQPQMQAIEPQAGQSAQQPAGDYYEHEYEISDPQQHQNSETDQYNEGAEAGQMIADVVSQQMGLIVAIVITIYIVLIFSAILITAPYHAALTRKKMEKLQLENLRFKSEITAWKLIKFRFANILILIITGGFGLPWIQNRKMKFFAAHTLIGGDLDGFSTLQAQQAKLGQGEELSDFLDADLGLDFGFGG